MNKNMTQTTYDFPLPNNRERYDLSLQELDELLSKAYYKGFKDGQDSIPAYITTSLDDDDWWDRPLTMSNDQWRFND